MLYFSTKSDVLIGVLNDEQKINENKNRLQKKKNVYYGT